MSAALASTVFLAAVAVLALLPFVPALREIRARRDVEPLSVEPGYRVDAFHFARRFRVLVRERYAEALATVEVPTTGERDGEIHLLVPDGHHLDDPRSATGDERLVLARGDLRIGRDRRQEREIYAEVNLVVGTGTECRAVYCEENLLLGQRAMVLRWAHAGRQLRVLSGVRLHGRATAGGEILLAAGARFERLHAPVIRTTLDPYLEHPASPAPTPLLGLDPHGLPGLVDLSAGRALLKGDLELPPGTRCGVDLVVHGSLRVGAGSRLEGAVKTRGTLELGEGSVGLRAIVSESDVHVGRGVRLEGPLLAEGKVHVAAGARVGSTDRPTTLRAEGVELSPGATVHGTLWAGSGGEVRT